MSTDHLDNESFTDFEKSCPLCMELFDLDDMGFLPCPCGYRICRFCWHRLKTYEDNIEAGFEDQDGSASSGRCPACRQVYSDVPAGFDSNLTAMLDSNKYKKKKKRLQNKQKQKLQEEKQKLKEILKRDEKSLAGLRVVQKNLVFVIGIQQRSHEELRREFSKLGKIHKLVIGNTNNTNLNTAYVTYTRPEDAIKAIQALNQGCLNSQLILNSQSKLMSKTTAGANNRPAQGILKASLGTTKYCNHWLKNLQCPKLPDCMYLHELADQEASFTKEDMQKNKHAEYEKKLIQEYLDKNKTNCELLTDTHNNLKNSNSENSNSSSSIDNLGLSNNTAENQLNHQMNLNEEDSRTRLPVAYEPFEFGTEDSSVFGSTRKFGSIASGHTYSSAFSLSGLPGESSSSSSDQPVDESRLSNLPEENCDKENGSASSSSGSNNHHHHQHNGSLMMLGQLHSQNGQQPQADEANGDSLPAGTIKSKLSASNNICINSSSYIDAQQLLTIDDSHNSITGSNNLNGNGNSSTNGALLLSSSSNAKSKCINIDNSRSSNKMRMNLIDEIIANSSDSSTTSYSTCSSGSNRLHQTDLNEFNNLILNGEHLNSLNLVESSGNGKFAGAQHSPTNHNHHNNHTVGSLEDDGLDFDPISVSTIGLQDLLKTSSCSTSHSANTGNLLNQNSATANTLNQLLFGHSLVHQPATPPQSQQYNPSQLNALNHPLGHLAQPSNLTGLNGVLHGAAPQPAKPSPLSQLAVNSERSNLFAGGLFAGSASNSIGSLGSLGSLNSNSLQQQSASTNGASTPVDPNDTWRNSLRALLPNVNITFSNSSSSSSANQTGLNPTSPQNQILFKQQISQQQTLAGNGQQLNPPAPIKPPTMSSFPVARQPQQQQQQQNAIKSSQQQQQQQQSFLNQLQQNHHQQMQQQQQPQNIYPLAFLHQQLLRQQQQAAAGLNLQFANANASFFNEPQQMKPGQMQASPSQANAQPQSIAPLQHLNNLQRFFSQQPHQQPPPGF